MPLSMKNQADIFIGLKSFNDGAVFVTSPKPEKEEWKKQK